MSQLLIFLRYIVLVATFVLREKQSHDLRRAWKGRSLRPERESLHFGCALLVPAKKEEKRRQRACTKVSENKKAGTANFAYASLSGKDLGL